jgi:hypothetical protein
MLGSSSPLLKKLVYDVAFGMCQSSQFENHWQLLHWLSNLMQYLIPSLYRYSSGTEYRQSVIARAQSSKQTEGEKKAHPGWILGKPVVWRRSPAVTRRGLWLRVGG